MRHPRIWRARARQAACETPMAGLIARILALPEGANRDQLIGVDAGAKLKRMPSAIYWGGNCAWGITAGRTEPAYGTFWSGWLRVRDAGLKCPSIPKEWTREA